MRFLADGPVLPDELLVARDAGKVIFFCGAGVSMARAGLDDFPTLAEKVIEGLGSTSQSTARRLFEASKAQDHIKNVGSLAPADRMFSMLEREFEVADIHAEVARVLTPQKDVDLSAHRILLDLSRGPDGHPKIITTNFDLLFQATDRHLQVHTAPDLPDPRRPQDLRGVVHLHGRVNDDYTRAYDDAFVLSSADFGRAYLADGWATRFIQGLMEGYQLVFVGYSADDPPVQYLLEALSDRTLARGGLYAFQGGAPDEAHAIWRSKGVRAIAYDPAEKHSALWHTLEAWAVRARDPSAWETRVLRQARRGPARLAPHERGWVRHMAMFPASARRISEARLPAEWLCVFDPLVRYGAPHAARGDRPGFDPFDAYGLDEVPPPPVDLEDRSWIRREVPTGAWDAFAPSRWDGRPTQDVLGARFHGPSAGAAADLPPRLLQLGRWLASVADQPAAAWWASGQGGLHPGVIDAVLARFERPYDDSGVAKAWRRIVANWRTSPRSRLEQAHDLKKTVKRAGWTAAALRDLESLLQPTIEVSRQYSSLRRPPGRKPRRQDLIRLEVEHHGLGDLPEPPVALLPQFVDVLRRALERGRDVVLEEIGFDIHPLPPISRDPNLVGGGLDQTRGLAPLFFQYLAAFRRLLAEDPQAARTERLRWRTGDPAFERLGIWAAGNADATDGITAAKLLIDLDAAAFWDMRHQRDLLLALRDRWSDFSPRARHRLEQRLLRGRPRWREENREQFLRFRAIATLERLAWLESQGCALTGDLAQARGTLKSAATDYDPSTGPDATASFESRGGAVRTITDATDLLEVPPRGLLEAARALSAGREWGGLTERRPLVGLAAARPSRLLAALRFTEASGAFPDWAWRTLLDSEGARLQEGRGLVLLAERLAALGPGQLAPLIHDVTRWLKKVAEKLAWTAPAAFDRLWARLLETLRHGPESARSAIRSNRPDWVMSAINSPPGHLAGALMRHSKRELQEGGTLDPSWLAKATELLELPDVGGRLAAVVFLADLYWFFYYDRSWTEARLLARRQGGPDDRAAFWSGYLRAGDVPPRPLYDLLKQDMLRLASEEDEDSDRTDQLAGLVLAGWMTPEDQAEGVCISDSDLRDTLVAGSDAFRRRALWRLGRWLEEHKDPDVQARILRLLRDVWPKQRVARSAEVSERLAELALGAASSFPEFAQAVSQHLRPIENPYCTVLAFDSVTSDLIEQHGSSVLRLAYALLGESAATWPYDAKSLVDRLALRPELARDPRLAELRRRMASG